MSLKSYLTEIADALRVKKETTEPIKAQDFAKEIEALSGGVTVEAPEGESKFLEGVFDGSPLTVTESGTVDISAMLDEQKLPLSINVDTDVKVIDVETLPSDKINKVAFIVNDGVRYKDGDAYPNGTIVHIYVVETLPEVGKGETANETYLYFLKSNDGVIPYVWFNSAWTQFPLDVFYSESEIPEGALNYFLYLDEDSNSQPINEKAIYRFAKKTEIAYLIANGSRMDSYGGMEIKVVIVDTLPEIGVGVLESDTTATLYYQKSDAAGYGYLSGSWLTADIVSSEFGFDYGGVINSDDQATDATKMYMVYDDDYIISSELYYYRDGWKGIGTYITAPKGEPLIGDVTVDMLGDMENPDTMDLSQATPRGAIYFNTALSTEEVVAAFADVTIPDNAIGIYIGMGATSDMSSNVIILLIKNDTSLSILLGVGDNTILAFDISHGWYTNLIGDDGVIYFPSPVYFVAPGVTVAEGTSIDNQQELYANVMGFSPVFDEGTGEDRPLAGSFDGSSIMVTENGTVDIGSMLEEQKLPLKVNVDVPIPDGYIVPEGTTSITSNGTYDITEYASASVNVPIPSGYIKPSGTREITANGTYNVNSYSSASVNVPIPDGYIKPEGTFEITENGTHEVTEYSNVKINVSDPNQFSTFIVNVPTDNKTITVKSDGDKNWGDGVTNAEQSHTYNKAGAYAIICSGSSLPSYLFGQGGTIGVNTSLIGATLSNKITYVTEALRNCINLTNVIIQEGIDNISSLAFYDCKSLTNIVIPKSVTKIYADAFMWCSSLTSFTVSEENETYQSIDGNVYTKDGKTLVRYAPGKTGSFTIPDSVTSIGDEAFSGCSSLTGVVIPDSVTSIGDEAFSGCSSLTNITIPNSVTSIGYKVFYNCSSLTSAEIPNSVTSIGNYAFYNCNSLTSIEIPASVTSIGAYAFEGYNLYKVINNSNLVFTIGDTDNGWIAYHAKILVDKDGNTTYKQDGKEYIETANQFLFEKENENYTLIAYLGAEETITLPTDINGNTYEIYQMRGVRNVTIPDSVASIDDYAFSGCSSLTGVVIPDSITSIGGSAFSGCSSLTNIIIPDSVTSIDDYAFYGCNSLTSIEIPASVTSIGSSAFGDCDSLMSIVVNKDNEHYQSTNGILYSKDAQKLLRYAPQKINTVFEISDSVTTISEGAIDGCTKLINVIIPNTVTLIDSYAFRDCYNLVNITIPNGITRIQSNTFYKCINLANITIPDSVTNIDSGAFGSCSSLMSVTIPDNVRSIGSSAFAHCSSLTSVIIGNSVTSIGEYAFHYCSQLADIQYSGTKEQWKAITFGSNWNASTGDYIITCTDGTVAKDGTET